MRRTSFALPLATVAAAVSLAGSTRADSLATGAPASTFDVKDYVTGLGQTTDFKFLPDGRMIITEKLGAAKLRSTTGTVTTAGTFAVNTTSEQGLLGVEVHPDFATNKTLFFYYSAGASIGGTDTDRHRIVSIVLKDDGTLDMASEKILVRGLHGPANHDGGSLAIGPDRKLYIGVGDTGCNSNVGPGGAITNYFATCLTLGNGKILRVNLDGTIPTDNPLVGVAAATACGPTCGTAISSTTAAPRTDIWAWGFRNPWRFWFDPVTGKLWVGDVGEVTFEEITIAQKGRHHGWPFREGAHGYPVTKCNDVTPSGDCLDPVYDCEHPDKTTLPGEDSDCQSITGGLIVDSCDWPTTFRGLYFFADNSTGQMWTLQPTAARDGIVPGSRKDFANFTGGAPVSIHLGPDGAVYVAILPGRIARIAPKTPVTCDADAGPGDVGPGDGGGTDAGPERTPAPRQATRAWASIHPRAAMAARTAARRATAADAAAARPGAAMAGPRRDSASQRSARSRSCDDVGADVAAYDRSAGSDRRYAAGVVPVQRRKARVKLVTSE
jgi:glucose/arabinose dehydrogenase